MYSPVNKLEMIQTGIANGYEELKAELHTNLTIILSLSISGIVTPSGTKLVKLYS